MDHRNEESWGSFSCYTKQQQASFSDRKDTRSFFKQL